MKVFRINPDFRIFACQKVHFFSIFPIEIAKLKGFQDFQYILHAPMYRENLLNLPVPSHKALANQILYVALSSRPVLRVPKL